MKLRTFSYLLSEGFKNVWSHRLMSVASSGVLMACMLMIGIVFSISANIDNYVSEIQKNAVVMAFFKDDVSREDALAATESIKNLDNISSVKFISKEEGLSNQEDSMGEEYKEIFAILQNDNPLPDGVQITISDLEQYNQTVESIRAVNGIDIIRQRGDYVDRLVAIRSVISIIGTGVILLLLIISLAIVSNTIKITMFTRKLEINIMKAVGATNRFIRTPFVIEGMLLGIIAGVVSTGFLYFIYKLAEQTLTSSFSGLGAFVPFTKFAFPLLGAFILMGALVGSIGSAISIGKYLRHEGSEFNAIF